MKQRHPDIICHFLKVNQGADGSCPVMLCLEIWEDDEMDGHRFHCHLDPPIQLPSSGDMNNQQGLEAVDEEILQLERVLVRECINKKFRGKSTAGTSMSISGGEMAFDVHSKYLMCAWVSCHCLRKKRSTVQLSGAFSPFMYVLRTSFSPLRGVNCKGLHSESHS